MSSGIKPSCVICAWRASCQKQFSMLDPSHCPDFTRDVTVKDYPEKKGVKVLIQGEPGTGKTTLVERLITKLKGVRVGGFLTREIREKGDRKGFRLITVDKQEGVLAHVDIRGGLKIGKYTVNLEDLENIGVASVIRALKEDDLVLIDEVGKMELLSGHFMEVVLMALDSAKPLVATISMDGPPFVEEVKGRGDVHLLTLTKANRDEILEEALRHLEGDI
jgi:nucleoside-triphosphatase